LLGDDFLVQDRYEQQADTYRIMEIEKLISYLFLTFILMIACFNVIGSLSMLIIDKRDDVVTLRNLGASDRQIVRIFLFEGRMISFFGAFAGVVLGLLLCWLQQEYGLIALGSSGSFVVDAYPVSVHASDVLLIFITVLLIGFLSVWYPVRFLSKRLLNK
jgi:lipoprotein-releasing system permease protein